MLCYRMPNKTGKTDEYTFVLVNIVDSQKEMMDFYFEKFSIVICFSIETYNHNLKELLSQKRCLKPGRGVFTYICSRHFRKDQLMFMGPHKVQLKPNEIPTLCIPQTFQTLEPYVIPATPVIPL